MFLSMPSSPLAPPVISGFGNSFNLLTSAFAVSALFAFLFIRKNTILDMIKITISF